jgi:hypothetical protein
MFGRDLMLVKRIYAILFALILTAVVAGGTRAGSLELSSGWNFVSFPLDPPGASISEALKDISPNIRVMWGYATEAGTWLKYRVPAPGVTDTGTLASLNPGKGYWIYMNSSDTLSMDGWSVPLSTTVHLNEGWNLVGYRGLDNSDINAALQDIAGKWTIAWNWDNGTWYSRLSSGQALPIPGFSLLNQKKAYWILVKPGMAVDWAPAASSPDLNAWLTAHPNVANAIKWQYQPADPANVYIPPTDADKVAWAQWTSNQKTDLNNAYLAVCDWFTQGRQQVQMPYGGLTDMPVNTHPSVNSDSVSVTEVVSPSYMWDLYVAHVAFSLAAELSKELPWSIADYDDESLRYLFDSTTMAWDMASVQGYSMGTNANRVPAKRADNLPMTALAPPLWTYPFLRDASLIGATRIETIGRVLDWMRQNLSHFYGNSSFGNMFAVWQYRGYPPLSRIVSGTVDTNNPGLGAYHWTAGCHGSVGLLNQVLRAVNIPVQPVWVCGHELPYFVTEKMYMDHGDDPYNQNVKHSNAPILSFLINEATYQSWFSNDLTINITDYASPACANVGRRAAEAGQ